MPIIRSAWRSPKMVVTPAPISPPCAANRLYLNSAISPVHNSAIRNVFIPRWVGRSEKPYPGKEETTMSKGVRVIRAVACRIGQQRNHSHHFQKRAGPPMGED